MSFGSVCFDPVGGDLSLFFFGRLILLIGSWPFSFLHIGEPAPSFFVAVLFFFFFFHAGTRFFPLPEIGLCTERARLRLVKHRPFSPFLSLPSTGFPFLRGGRGDLDDFPPFFPCVHSDGATRISDSPTLS